jgi:hypothetical protein
LIPSHIAPAAACIVGIALLGDAKLIGEGLLAQAPFFAQGGDACAQGFEELLFPRGEFFMPLPISLAVVMRRQTDRFGRDHFPTASENLNQDVIVLEIAERIVGRRHCLA